MLIVSTDKYPNLASKYQIEALPTLILFKDGQPADKIKGVHQAPQSIQHLSTWV